MAAHVCIQGDGFSYDYGSDGVSSFASGWVGLYNIVDRLGVDGTIFASGSLNPSSDGTKMELRIAPAVVEGLEVSTFILVVELSNADLNFKREVMQDSFAVKEQGVFV